MTPTLALALVWGLLLGLGLWSVIGSLPRLSRPSLATRVAPYVRDVSPGAREMLGRTPVDPLPVFGFLLTPLLTGMRHAVAALAGNPTQTARRLRQAGSPLAVDEFRSRQLAWGAAGAALGVLASLAAVRSQGIPFVAQVVIVLVFAVGGVVGRDYLLQRQARARLARMAEELPTVLEFLTLSLSAGEGILDAIRRVSRVSSGELSAELAGVIADVNTGTPFADTLTRRAADLELPAFTRFTEQLTGALDRGTPLVEVLRAQAQDSRDDAKRRMLELAGKKEVAMLVPLVFLILPVTIAFAIFPGIWVLQVGF
ncbi:pilus assembly protein [Glaciihabitans arcticus]|uniref:Pilus assembly protein n=1 Tax=Glaciihabitans arcticus TaxID=2668039 RepID=A0A4Q9GUV6_9MICO|nr:pilus assembly protein [Glaciihabitans arcticus]